MIYKKPNINAKSPDVNLINIDVLLLHCNDNDKANKLPVNIIKINRNINDFLIKYDIFVKVLPIIDSAINY
jgi:hypothetical protein